MNMQTTATWKCDYSWLALKPRMHATSNLNHELGKYSKDVLVLAQARH